MDIKEFLKPIMAKVERVSVHNKQLKSSWKEDAMVFTNVKPIDTHSVDVTVYGNTIEQIAEHIGDSDINWSTHVTIMTNEVSSRDIVFLVWKKDNKNYMFQCKMMSVGTYGRDAGKVYGARYMAVSMGEITPSGTINWIAKE